MQTEPMKLFPLGRYPGSKFRLMKKLLPLLPKHYHYVSVYGGLAGDILGKPRSPAETFNDLDGSIYNLFRVLQDAQQRSRLIGRMRYTPYSQRFYRDAVGILAKPIIDSVQHAWALLTVANQGVSSRHPAQRRPSEWSYERIVRAQNRWLRLPANLSVVAERFRRVQISDWPWQEVVDRLDTVGTLFFVDPPYLPSTLSGDRYYPHTMSADDHEELLAQLQLVKGRAMVCGYQNDLYQEMLNSWRRVEIQVRAQMAFGKTLPKRTEVVWMNYGPNGKRLKESCHYGIA